MTDVIERLRAENRADAARLEARSRLVSLMDGMVEGLEAAGFKPKLTLEETGLLSLKVDPEAIEHGPALLPAPECAASEADQMPAALQHQDQVGPPVAPDQVAEAPRPVATAKPKRKRVLKPSKLVTGPYSDEEIATTLEMIDNGASNREIAEALNRHPGGVNVTVARLKKERAEEQAQDDAPGAAPEATPQPSPEAITSTGPDEAPFDPQSIPAGAPKFDPSMPYAERECLLMLEAVGFPGRWTPALTLTLVEALSRGDGLSNAARACEVDKDVARLRWHNICPEPSWEAQQVLLKVLRGMVAKKVA